MTRPESELLLTELTGNSCLLCRCGIITLYGGVLVLTSYQWLLIYFCLRSQTVVYIMRRYGSMHRRHYLQRPSHV